MLSHVGRACLGMLILFASANQAGAQAFNFSFMDFLGASTQYQLVDPGATTSASVQGFASFRKGLWRDAAAQGVSAQTFERAFAGVTPDPWVLEKAAYQPEFTKPIWDYVSNAVSTERVGTGQQVLEQQRGVLDAIEARYGVSRHIVVAIWGLESTYGRVLDDRSIVKPVIRSLATLAYLDPKRGQYGRKQLLAALTILERGDTTPEHMLGSWAGAMGHTQFIPTTYLAHAADFDGDGRRDIWQSVPDALASTANYLAASGWRKGETWGYEVTVPPGFDFALSGQKKTVEQWRAAGIQRTQARAFPRGSDTAMLLLPAGARGPAFLMLKNFEVIKRYNNADAYAIAVGHLADRLFGAGPIAASWPVDDRTLGASEREELQRLLIAEGFDPGGVDGQIGPQTRNALRAYQASIGLAPDGFATKTVLDRLRSRG